MNTHEICVATRNAGCVCGAPAGRDCDCGPGAVHLARAARARRSGLISHGDFASVVHDADVFTGLTLIIDPAARP